MDHGLLTPKIQALGIPVYSLGMRRGVPNPLAILRLARWLWKHHPDVIQTWMYHADLAGCLAARLVGRIPVSWGIRHSDLSREGNNSRTLRIVKICALLSRWLPTRIVCCSEASRRAHVDARYSAEKMVVIPNGFDVDAFMPDAVARNSIRKELAIPDGAPVIGMAARFEPIKDHDNFVRAAKILYRTGSNVHFVLCGRGVSWDSEKLARWIDEAGMRHRFHLLGLRDDMSSITAAFDIATLTSFGEAFPNVVGEAMSCAVPCVVTDVGDTARIVGETGTVVPSRNPDALASAWRTMLEMGREGRRPMGIAARQRIKECFDIAEITGRYEHLFEELAHSRRA
jgi:glycosyltransferase involved in cell wall biosynthesis